MSALTMWEKNTSGITAAEIGVR